MSFPRYPKYKPSGVEWLGDVPEHWDATPLRRVISKPLTNGIFKKKEEYGEGTLLVNVFDVYRDDFRIHVDHLDRVKCDAAEESVYGVKPGDLFFVRSSLKQDGIAAVCVAGELPAPVVFECHLIQARPNKEVFDGRFGSYLLNASVYRATMIAKAKITTMTTIDQEAILSTVLPIPSLDEQSAIAGFLDRETSKIDGLVGEQRRLIELLKEKRQAVISHAVTKGLNPQAPLKPSGIHWLGDVPEHWDVMPLKRLIASGTSISYGIVQPGDSLDEGVPFVQTTNMTTGHFELESLQKTSAMIAAQYPRSMLTGGEVLLGIRASIGAAHVVPESLRGANLSRGVARIVPNEKIVSSYLVKYFATVVVTHYWQLSKQGSTFNEVSIETVRELSVTTPPKEEQVAILRAVDAETAKLDALTAEAERAIVLLQERRTALISAAVTGKIDVRPFANKEVEA